MARSPVLRSSSRGFSLLLGVIVTFALLAVGVAAFELAAAADRLGMRSLDRVRALAAADSGIERALYLKLVRKLPLPPAFESHEPPFSDPDYYFRLEVHDDRIPVTLRATGVAGTAVRSVEVAY